MPETTEEKPVVKRVATKTKVYRTVAETSGLTAKEVKMCLECLGAMMGEELGPHGPGKFTIPDLISIHVHEVPPVAAHLRPDPRNPGKVLEIPDRPAKKKIKAKILKGLRDMI